MIKYARDVLSAPEYEFAQETHPGVFDFQSSLAGLVWVTASCEQSPQPEILKPALVRTEHKNLLQFEIPERAAISRLVHLIRRASDDSH